MSEDRSDCISPNLPYLNVNIDACTTSNPHYAKFSSKLVKVAQIMQKKCATGNIMPMPNIAWLQCAAWCDFFVKWLHFLQFSHKPNFDLEPDYFGKPLNRRFKWYIAVQKYCQLFMHESNILLLKICHSNQREWKTPKPPFPLWHVDPHLIHPSLNRPNAIWIQSGVFPQYNLWTDRHRLGDNSIPRALTY